ncbi:MAG: hypothetical protein IT289_10220 [Oligoflexia bacterium]|nr:hypothetical protein [Oligoflexia bacterium]
MSKKSHYRKYSHWLKKGALAFFTLAGVTMYLMVPGCSGNKNDPRQNPYGQVPPGGAYCPPGQPCAPIPGGPGVPLLNGPAYSSFAGGEMLLQVSGTGVVPGQPANGQANFTGTVLFQPGACGMLPPGQYPIQGTGVFVSGYAGSIGGVEGSLSIPGGAVTVQGAIWLTSDPMNPGAPPLYRLQGNMMAPICNRNITLL